MINPGNISKPVIGEKGDKQAIQKIANFSTQPASSSHPQAQQYQGQRPSKGRGISRNAL
jgi:hypothetical protein